MCWGHHFERPLRISKTQGNQSLLQKCYAPDNTPRTAGSNFNVRDLHGGARWMPELGLYDDRNRFMSPDLGRFLQPDPIGFKGDASNLYRYCGNDWANRTDPMGLEGGVTAMVSDLARWAAKLQETSVKIEVTGTHIPATKENLIATKQLVGLSTARALSAESASRGLRIGQVSGNSVPRDKDGKPSSGEHIPSESKAAYNQIHQSYDAMVNENPDPKKQNEYSGWGAQNNKNPKDNIIFGPYPGGRKGFKNTSTFRKDDPSPGGYHRTFVVYTHPFYRNSVDSDDMPRFSSMDGKPTVYLATPQARGSGRADPQIIQWPNP